MQNTTQATSDSHMNVGVNQNKEPSSKLIERYPVANTPFVIIKQQDEIFLTLGKYKIKYPNYTEMDYITLVENRDWDLILDVIGICIQQSH